MKLKYQKNNQRRQAVCKQTDWLQRGSERLRRQTADQREKCSPKSTNNPLEYTWVCLSRFEHTKGSEGSREWMGLRQQTVTVFPCKMLSKCWSSGHSPSLFILTTSWKSAFQGECNQEHMYEFFLTPTSFAIYFFQVWLIYNSCRRHVLVPSRLLLPCEV